MSEGIKLAIKDEDVGDDEEVAVINLTAGDLSIPPYRPTKTDPIWHKLTNNGKPAGQIKLHCTFKTLSEYQSESLALDKKRAVSKQLLIYG